MSTAFESALAFTVGYGVPGLGEEGGAVNNPYDPGGFTYRGITLSSFRAWREDSAANSAELLAISEDELVAFYRARFWNPVRGDDLPAGAGLSVFDMGVNAGPRRSALILQRAVGVDQDGSIGPATVTAAGKLNPTLLIGRLAQLQLAYYQALPTWPTFGKGWSGRVERREAAAAKARVAA